jgi:RND family efflux transporter MFP subunit
VSPFARRIGEAALGALVLGAAVAWLSGGCEERVAPGRIAGESAAKEGQTAVAEEVTAPAVEWSSGQLASARHTAVSSRVLARIEEVRVRAGSRVAEGDVLVVLEAGDLAARVAGAEQAVRSAEARLALARSEYARAQELFREGVGTRQRLDQAAAELRSAEAGTREVGEGLSEARTTRGFSEIRAPVSGRVVDRLAEPGDTAVPGEPLLRIYDPSVLRVEAPVRESLAVALRVGQRLRVEVPALGGTLEGEIDELVPFAEPGARSVLVKVRLAGGDERLFAGMFARVAVPAGERRRLLVPAAAVERIGQLEFVDVVGADNALERRAVTTGEPAEGGRVEVLSGLRAGERVLVRETAEPARSAVGFRVGELRGLFWAVVPRPH